jgi:hypothetical protein
MVEVFKTNVKDQRQAFSMVLQLIEKFSSYHANFDLEDCDRILRIECKTETINSSAVISVLKQSGFYAEVLEDEPSNEIQLLIDTLK